MKKINIGVIVNTHGLKGEVKVKLFTDFPQIRFAKKAHLFMELEGIEKELIVESSRVQKELLLVCFKEYQDINLIESWVGNKLYIHEDQLQTLREDETYYHEIMDCRVFDEEEKEIGKVVELIETGANLILRVKGEEEHLIPFVKAFVPSVDSKNKIIHVKMMEGL